MSLKKTTFTLEYRTLMWVDLVKNQECLRRDFNPVLNFSPPPRRWFLPLHCVGADWFQDQAAVQHTERHRQDAAPLLPRKELRRRRRFPLFHFLQRPPRLWTWGHFTGGQTQGETALCVSACTTPLCTDVFFFIQWNSFIGVIQVGTAWLASLCGCFNDTQIMQLVNQIIYENIYSDPAEGDTKACKQPLASHSLREGVLLLHRGGLASFRWVKYVSLLSLYFAPGDQTVYVWWRS